MELELELIGKAETGAQLTAADGRFLDGTPNDTLGVLSGQLVN